MAQTHATLGLFMAWFASGAAMANPACQAFVSSSQSTLVALRDSEHRQRVLCVYESADPQAASYKFLLCENSDKPSSCIDLHKGSQKRVTMENLRDLRVANTAALNNCQKAVRNWNGQYVDKIINGGGIGAFTGGLMGAGVGAALGTFTGPGVLASAGAGAGIGGIGGGIGGAAALSAQHFMEHSQCDWDIHQDLPVRVEFSLRYPMIRVKTNRFYLLGFNNRIRNVLEPRQKALDFIQDTIRFRKRLPRDHNGSELSVDFRSFAVGLSDALSDPKLIQAMRDNRAQADDIDPTYRDQSYEGLRSHPSTTRK
jgi:hypothetical protein